MDRHAHTIIKWTFCLIFLFTNGIAFGQTKKLKEIEKILKAEQAIKSSSNEFLTGRITITINRITYHNPPKNGKRRCEQEQTVITSGFYGRSNQYRVKMYMTKPSERLTCDNCPVFEGSSKFELKRDPATMKIIESKDYPLQVAVQRIKQDWVLVGKEKQYVVTAKSSANGCNEIEAINIKIKPYQPEEEGDDEQLASLVQQVPPYAIYITGGRWLKNSDRPETSGENLGWDDLAGQLISLDEPVGLGIPFQITDNPVLLQDIKGFDAFLLNPWHVYSFSGMATPSYYKDSDYEMTTTVSVNINLSADTGEVLAPLEPDDDRLAPLVPEK